MSPDGIPHLTNMNYLAAADAPTIRMTTTTDRVKGRNLLRDPRAVLHVQGDDWFNFVVVEGDATVQWRPSQGIVRQIELYDLITTLRGPADRREIDDEMISNHRMAVLLKVHRVYGQVVSKRVA